MTTSNNAAALDFTITSVSRVNRKGEFNVPIGRYDNPKIVDRENLLAVATTLENTELRTGDFGDITADCEAGDLVYLDPPYDPLS